MDNSSKNKWWLWFVIPIAGLTTWKIFRNTARQSNRVTEDMTTNEAQATLFYSYFGITKALGIVSATPIVMDSTKRLVGWLARNVNEWDKVQNAFTRMCGGNYTIIQAASMALDTANFKGFTSLISNALTQPRIFCGSQDSATLYNANRYGGIAGENFKANSFVGRCTGEDDMYYKYISWRDGCTYQAPKDSFYIV